MPIKIILLRTLCVVGVLMFPSRSASAEFSHDFKFYHVANRSVVSADTLTLDVSLERALNQNPRIQAAMFEFEAAQAIEKYSSRLPDPFLEFEVENFASSGVELPVFTTLLSQRIEIGGKRSARTKLAAIDRKLANLDQSLVNSRLETQVRIRYAEAVAAQSNLKAAIAAQELARSVVQITSHQVEVGERPAVDLIRAEITMSDANTGVIQAKNSREATFVGLALLWGDVPDFTALTESTHLEHISDLGSLLERFESSIQHHAWNLQVEKQESSFRLEKSKRMPDITVSVGYRHFDGTGDRAAVAKLAVGLPFFNGNRAAASAARSQLDKTKALRSVALLEAQSHLAELYGEIKSKYSEATTLRDEILPRAQKVTELTKVGYQEGKFSLLDLLEAQKTLAMSKARYYSVVRDYQITTSELAQLIEPATSSEIQ